MQLANYDYPNIQGGHQSKANWHYKMTGFPKSNHRRLHAIGHCSDTLHRFRMIARENQIHMGHIESLGQHNSPLLHHNHSFTNTV